MKRRFGKRPRRARRGGVTAIAPRDTDAQASSRALGAAPGRLVHLASEALPSVASFPALAV